MLERLQKGWSSYKYRFVPWLTFNLRNRTVRHVNKVEQEVTNPAHLLHQLTALTAALRCLGPPSPAAHQKALTVMERVAGFHVVRAASKVGGVGVVVGGGGAARGRLVGLYPGALYLPHQPVLLQSLANPFFFRCADGLLLDGSDRAISKMLYKSCAGRDHAGLCPAADTSWLTPHPTNPLSVGQYVNNQSSTWSSNVAYQEVTLQPGEISPEERQFLPNLWYAPPEGVPVHEVPLRLVMLVATRDIDPGEELFSNYFTIIH